MSAHKQAKPLRGSMNGRPHPNYDDEIGVEQMAAIRRLADPDGKRAAKRVILYPSLV